MGVDVETDESSYLRRRVPSWENWKRSSGCNCRGRERRVFDYLVVGAGFAGSVIAERLARVAGKSVLLVDRRAHIGGNAFDHYNEHGILVQRYGPHIFHTNSLEVFEYL